MDLQSAATAFLDEKRVAIVGVSRNPAETANGIYRKFLESGYEVFAVNPAADEVEGVTSYASVKDIPGGVGAAVVVTTPSVTAKVAQDCVDAGVHWVWMHKSFGDSVSDEGVQLLRQHEIGVIPGACPMMFLNADGAHKFFCSFFKMVGRIPRTV